MIAVELPATCRRTREQFASPAKICCGLLLLIAGMAHADDATPAPPAEDETSAADRVPREEAAPLEATPSVPDGVSELVREWTGRSGNDWIRCDDCCVGCDGVLGCDSDPGCDACGTCWGSGGGETNFYLGVDFSVLKPDVAALNVPAFAASVKPEHDFEIAPRFFGGFQTCNGLGGQISYWTLETSGINPTSVSQIANNIDLQAADVDFTKTSQLGDWSIQVGAGGRWGQVESHYFGVNNPGQYLRTEFDGSGPTFVLNLRRPIGCGQWALVGEGRASFLWGDTNVDSTVAPGLQVDGDRVDIWEGRVGVEWTGTTTNGSSLFFVRALFEAQKWNVPAVGQIGSPDIDFLGPTMSMGFVF